MDKQLEMEVGPELPTESEIMAAVQKLFGETMERVVVIGMNDKRVRILGAGHVYETDTPGLLTLASGILQRDMLSKGSHRRTADKPLGDDGGAS